MLYCWDAWAIQVENGGMFAGMNLLVHSVMYSYYCLTSLGFRFSNGVRSSITNIQILQMLLGIVICVVPSSSPASTTSIIATTTH